MLIGELAAKSGLSRDTIRFYEKQGLISVSWKERRDNNYKEYSDEVLETLLTIKRVKSFGFTLNEAADLIGTEGRIDFAHRLSPFFSRNPPEAGSPPARVFGKPSERGLMVRWTDSS